MEMESVDLVKAEARSLLEIANGLVVSCDEEYAQAGEFVMAGKAMIKKITEYHQADIDRWHAGHKAAIAKRDEDLDQVKRAVKIAGDKAGDYKLEQDRLAREEQARIEAARRRQEEERRLAEAARLEAEGKAKEAEAVINEPIPAPRPTKFESPVPKVAGLSMRGKWKGKIVNPKAVKREYCDPTQWRIDMRIEEYTKYVKDPTDEQKAELCAEIGGVEMEFVSSPVGRLK